MSIFISIADISDIYVCISLSEKKKNEQFVWILFNVHLFIYSLFYSVTGFVLNRAMTTATCYQKVYLNLINIWFLIKKDLNFLINFEPSNQTESLLKHTWHRNFYNVLAALGEFHNLICSIIGKVIIQTNS